MSRPILHCHCVHAAVLDPDAKARVLDALTAADAAFDAVPDLCAASARRDPSLAAHAASPELVVVACHPRAVRWLFHAAGAPLRDDARVLDLRAGPVEDVVAAVLEAAR